MNRQRGIIVLTLSFALCGCAGNESSAGTGGSGSVSAAVRSRPALMAEKISVNSDIVPALPEYTVSADFSNTINQELVASMSDEMRALLHENDFIVTDNGYMYEFHELYEENRYEYVPSFITTDSVLHAFHLYYAWLQKETERTYLKDALADMSMSLYEESRRQLSLMEGTEWESAAARNVDYCAVGAVLLGLDAEGSKNAEAELDNIYAAEGMDLSPLFSTADREYMQDYSQFIPRGYYTQSEELKQYFRAMMWYGQMNFSQNAEDLNRSALLMCLAVRDGAEELWEKVYTTTAFFAGESDDSGYYEYLPVIEKAYGSDVSAEALAGNDSAFAVFAEETGKMEAPKINSMAVFDRTIDPDRDLVTRGYRLLGQRFTVDGHIMQKLVYRDVDEADGKRRNLPDALDVPAALGSEEALRILQETTDVNTWPDYEKNMQALKEEIAAGEDTLWQTGVSASWLGALSPLTRQHGTGWPMFMQNRAWADKDLNTFLGSYTELKHDTVLYAKQVMAEMGGIGWMTEPPDDRGYVEPQIDVYLRLAAAAKQTRDGLKGFGLLSEEAAELSDHLIMITDKLAVIAEKELKGELPDDEEFDFIRSYGGQLEHLWMRTIDGDIGYRTMDHPSSLVTDIATDPNGLCLQVGTGLPNVIYVLVQFDGEIRICKGAVYSFYQFTRPLSQRMTDEEWNEMTRYDHGSLPEMPAWTDSFFRKFTTAGHVGADRLGYIGKAAVMVDDLNSRSEPSADSEKLEAVKMYYEYKVYEIRENEGYTWYRIGENRWIADKNGEWISYSSAE